MSAAHPPVLGDGIGLRSGQVAAAAGVNVETLRYYERRGLLAEPHRSSGGHRLYDASSVTTLRVIKAAQRLGFTLEEVAELLEVGRHRHRPRGVRPGDAGLQARARAKLAEVEERITDLVAIRDNLQAALDAGCDDLIACADTDCCPIPFATITRRPAPAAQDRSDR
ncbi:MerR family transcriptional regulator [Blastococcus jejuensis]|uniref:MerR family transcriptional regulator n=1 Tax=Blastococcus jejuensis TaxID=351224 RepID=UPI0031D3C8CB